MLAKWEVRRAESFVSHNARFRQLNYEDSAAWVRGLAASYMFRKNTKIPLRAGHVVTLRGDGGQLVVALVLSFFAKAKKPRASPKPVLIGGVHTFRAVSTCSQASQDRSNSEISLHVP